nr:response regulator [uncultured Methanospirillum sp.]
MNDERKKILIVEDEFITAMDLAENLEFMGFSVAATTDTAEEVLSLALEHSPDLILMDINLKGEMTGIEASNLIKNNLDIPIIFLTGQSDDVTISKAIESEPFGYLIKPFDDRSLKTSIAMALYKYSVEQKIKSSELRYRTIAESSDNFIAILDAELKFEYINNAGLSLLQTIPDRVIGSSISDYISSPFVEEIVQEIHNVIQLNEKRHVQGQLIIKDQEMWIDSTLIPLNQDCSDRSQILWIANDITDSVRLQNKLNEEGIIQIEKNMEQFQILNDEIRNPLSIIATCVSLDEPPSGPQILKAVKRIDDIVTQLDKGWIISNKVRTFLLRHYQHGKLL